MNKPRTTIAAAACVFAAAAAANVGLRAADSPATARVDYAATKGYVETASKPAAGDWLMWGGTPHRNMVSAEKNPPTDWDVGELEDPNDNKNIRWEQHLGSKAYGNPVIAGGKVFVGTNNEGKRDPATVGPDGRVVIKPITIARDLGRELEIASGLTEDDRVIATPPDGIAAGDKVSIAGEPEPAGLPKADAGKPARPPG